ncbi:unnamed protein product [Phytomonas sp. Hart1]|nr:unnamed protein product [Phytomonas sp. Hart1]|eukprot:CCW71310.1 unnamed protein product [Phytomonas sp. isolate Hart1]
MSKGKAAKSMNKSVSSQNKETQSQTPISCTQESKNASQRSSLLKRSRSQFSSNKSMPNTPMEKNKESKGVTTMVEKSPEDPCICRSSSSMARLTEANCVVENACGSGSSQTVRLSAASDADGTPSQQRGTSAAGHRETSHHGIDAVAAPSVEERRIALQQIPLRCIPIYKRLAECGVGANDLSFAAVITQRAMESITVYTDHE